MPGSSATSTASRLWGDAVSLLRTLPPTRAGVPEARARFECFRASHPGVAAELFVTRSAIPDAVDYDLVIEDGEGTAGFSWRPNHGIPWTVKHAEHWTAGSVLAIGDDLIDVREALVFLQFAGGDHSDLLGRLLRYGLIRHAIRQSTPPVSPVELQAAADRFRRNRGLFDALAARRWLEQAGLTPRALEAYLSHIVQARKLERRITRGRLRSCFEEHAREFDMLKLAAVDAPTATSAAALASEARQRGLLAATQHLLRAGRPDAGAWSARLATHRAFELASPFLTAPTGTILELAPDHRTHRVAEVLHRTPAAFDAQTQAVVGARLFDEWLGSRRRQVDVRWYLS